MTDDPPDSPVENDREALAERMRASEQAALEALERRDPEELLGRGAGDVEESPLVAGVEAHEAIARRVITDPELRALAVGAPGASWSGRQEVLADTAVRCHEDFDDPELRKVAVGDDEHTLIKTAVVRHTSVALRLLEEPELARQPTSNTGDPLLMMAVPRHDEVGRAALEHPDLLALERPASQRATLRAVITRVLHCNEEATLEAMRPGGPLAESGHLSEIVSALADDQPGMVANYLRADRLEPAGWPLEARLALLQSDHDELRRQAMRAMEPEERPEQGGPAGPTP